MSAIATVSVRFRRRYLNVRISLGTRNAINVAKTIPALASRTMHRRFDQSEAIQKNFRAS